MDEIAFSRLRAGLGDGLMDAMLRAEDRPKVVPPPKVPVSAPMDVALIPVVRNVIGDEEVNSISARDLYVFLGVKKDFSNWIKGRISKYNFTEDVDYILLAQIGEAQPCTSSSISANKKEYIITLNMAKELSMVERNTRGKEARQYFIECERVKDEVKAKPTNSIKIPDFNNPLESAIAFAESSERAAEVTRLYIGVLKDNASIISERDEALRTKHYINNKKTASAMGTAGAMAKRVKKLEAELRLVDWIGERSM